LRNEENEMKTKTRHDAEWLVLKYGGTSVSSLERWETIAVM
jgi:aspartokinase